MRPLILICCLLLAGCGERETVSFASPCGVITDSLKTVRGATPADTQRIDIHFERGVRAGCWTR